MFIRDHVRTEKYRTFLVEQKIMPQKSIKRMERQLLNESLRNPEFWENLLFDENNSSMASSMEDDNDPNNVEHRPVYACNNNYLPSNIEEIHKKKSRLQEIRSERIEKLKNDEFYLELHDNPIYEAGFRFKEEIEKLELVTCTICHEKWFHKLTPKTKKCERCAKEKKVDSIPLTFSDENNMNPGQQPPELKNLTVIEAAAISIIIPVTKIYNHRGGGSTLRGHSISYEQDIEGFATELPRVPDQLGIIVIRAHGTLAPFKANKHRILAALRWLKANNPYYKDITIREEHANQYPNSYETFVEGLPSYDSETTTTDGTSEDQENDLLVATDSGQVVDSVVLQQIPVSTLRNQVQNAVRGEIDWPNRSECPVSEFQPGYFWYEKYEKFVIFVISIFSKAFPHLFPRGVADWSDTRKGKKPSLLAYISHLTRLDYGEDQNPFAKDPRFVHHAFNMYMRYVTIKSIHPRVKKYLNMQAYSFDNWKYIC